MRLGIDFGTTRVVVAAVDRGNYPVVMMDCPDGMTRDWFPPLVAVREGEWRYGWAAWQAQSEPGWTVVRGLKRILGASGLQTQLEVAGHRGPVGEILAELMRALYKDLRESSHLPLSAEEPLEVMLGVPARANSNQRFLTAEAFRRAGFRVLGILNEPSAASIEFGHRLKEGGGGRDACVLVYDLGGGTFDASLVAIEGRTHTVLESEGIETLGGEDFDEILGELALQAAGLGAQEQESLCQAEWFRLHEDCREKKEALNPNSRRINIDLEAVREGWGQVTVGVAEFYEHCRPLLEETLHLTDDLLARHGFGGEEVKTDAPPRLEAIYMTGGGSELPLVARVLRERYGRRVKRSVHSRFATAIGLAIQADEQAGYVLRDRFTRYFGVWREAECGTRSVFDPLFAKGQVIPGPGDAPLTAQRTYTPAHNIGHFRYLECSQYEADGQPRGEITVWDDILFPFAASLSGREDLAAVPVERTPEAARQVIREVYQVDAGGSVTVTLSNLTANYHRHYRLARWAPREEPIRPTRRGRARGKPAGGGG